VARGCGADRAPDDLRVRIVAQLQRVTLEYGTVEFRPE
jgi:hypothetical protein